MQHGNASALRRCNEKGDSAANRNRRTYVRDLEGLRSPSESTSRASKLDCRRTRCSVREPRLARAHSKPWTATSEQDHARRPPTAIQREQRSALPASIQGRRRSRGEPGDSAKSRVRRNRVSESREHAFQSRIGHPDRKHKKRRISASSSNQNDIRSATHARLFTGNLAAPSKPNRPFAAHLPPARQRIRIPAACTRCRTPAFDPLRSSRT